MELTDKEEKFIKNRAQRARAWPFVGGFLLCLVLGFGSWLFFYRPLLANPFIVLSKLNEASIPSSTLILMAAMLPFFVLMCIILLLTIVLFGFGAFAKEKKYKAIINRLIGPTDLPKRGGFKETEPAQHDALEDAGKPR